MGAMLIGTMGAFWDYGRERYQIGKLPPAKSGSPNIILITLDTLRADHVSAYGYGRATTPNLDRLAKSGVLFENAFSNSSWTLPAHASLFTGRLPHDHNADWTQPLGDKYPTLAEVLTERGYLTAAFSANTSYVSPEWCLGRGFSHFAAHGSSVIEDVTSTVYGKKLALNVLPRLGYFDIPGRKRAQQVNQELFDWLDRSESKPFFAFLNYFDIHDPYLTEEPYQTRFANAVARGDLINFQFQANTFRRKASLTEREVQAEIDGYDGCLAYLDAKLGELFSELSRRGIDKNTLIIVTSDHGEAFGNHDLFGHGNGLYIDSLHVPLIILWPDKIPSGTRVSQLVSLNNVPATIMALLGDRNPTFPGNSLVRLWSGNPGKEATEPLLADLSPGRFKDGLPSYPATKGGLRSLVAEQWHFILSESGRAELYAWREDPAEVHNLAESEKGRQVVEEMKQRLNALTKAE
jgi:arylsulfatase A-like enzyme